MRLFDDLMGGQASWLLPAALVALVGGLWLTRRAPRTDRTRAALLLWGGWLIVTAAVFSYSQGVIHTYYAVALAPAIAALAAIGVHLLWQHRERIGARLVAAGVVAVTGLWSYVLLDRTPSWEPWLGVLVLAASAVTVAALLASAAVRGRPREAAGLVALVAAVIATLSRPGRLHRPDDDDAHTAARSRPPGRAPTPPAAVRRSRPAPARRSDREHVRRRCGAERRTPSGSAPASSEALRRAARTPCAVAAWADSQASLGRARRWRRRSA